MSPATAYDHTRLAVRAHKLCAHNNHRDSPLTQNIVVTRTVKARPGRL